MSAHPENRKPVGQKFADQEPEIDGAELEKKAEQRVTTLRQEVSCQAGTAQKQFWDLLPDFAVPPGIIFVPFTNSKLFTAPKCLDFPSKDAARCWFQALCEEQKVAESRAGTGNPNGLASGLGCGGGQRAVPIPADEEV